MYVNLCCVMQVHELNVIVIVTIALDINDVLHLQ